MASEMHSSSRRPSTAVVEPLEGRDMKSVSVSFDQSTFTLNVTSDNASDAITVNPVNTFGQQVVANGQIVFQGAFNVQQLAVRGNGGNDRITVNLAVPSLITGGTGNDVLTGSSRNDRIFGESGNDRLDGRAGNDVLSGSFGDDVLIGGAGTDSMFGGDGNDIISAKDGNSELVSGGAGLDSATLDRRFIFFGADDNESSIEFTS